MKQTTSPPPSSTRRPPSRNENCHCLDQREIPGRRHISPSVAALLNQVGHDALAVRDLALQHATDATILEQALGDDRLIVSHDTDFGTLLALQRRSKPSFILIRSADSLTATEIAALIIDNFGVMVEDLTAGAIVTFARGHLRSRRLPLQ